METNTVKLHRVFKSTPEMVYTAFLDPAAMCKWLPPNGFTGTVHHMDARVGGTYKMSFTNFGSGASHSFGGEYLELVPNEKIVNTDRFDDPNLPGEMVTTVTLKAVSVGTDQRHAGRHSGDDTCGSMLSRLGGIAHAAGDACRGRDTGCVTGEQASLLALGNKRTGKQGCLPSSPIP